MSAPLAAEHTTPWFTPTPSSAWQDFHRQWWGTSGAARLESALSSPPSMPVLHIEQSEVWLCTALSGGAILVRDEMVHAYDRICSATATDQGVAYLAQAGAGKSYLLMYLVLRCMARSRTVVLTHNLGIVFVVDEAGVRALRTANTTVMDFLELRGSRGDSSDQDSPGRPWVLIDSSLTYEPPSAVLTSLHLFTVVLSNPVEAEYEGWTARSSAPIWLLNPWSNAELLHACVHPTWQFLN